MTGEREQARAPDVAGLPLSEAMERLAGWRVDVVTTSPPDDPSGRAARRGARPLPEYRVLRQVQGPGKTVVLTVAPEASVDAEGR